MQSAASGDASEFALSKENDGVLSISTVVSDASCRCLIWESNRVQCARKRSDKRLFDA